jgi:hypothetical protein
MRRKKKALRDPPGPTLDTLRSFFKPAPISSQRKKNFTLFLSGREDWGNPIDCSFLQTSGKSMKKNGSNGMIPPSPQNEGGDLVVLGL